MEDSSKKEILEAIGSNSKELRQEILHSADELRAEMKADKHEVLEAISAFAEQVDGRFYRLETDVASVKSTMVTKDYMEGRLAAMSR